MKLEISSVHVMHTMKLRFHEETNIYIYFYLGFTASQDYFTHFELSQL